MTYSRFRESSHRPQIAQRSESMCCALPEYTRGSFFRSRRSLPTPRVLQARAPSSVDSVLTNAGKINAAGEIAVGGMNPPREMHATTKAENSSAVQRCKMKNHLQPKVG